jgi:hypothetical protein
MLRLLFIARGKIRVSFAVSYIYDDKTTKMISHSKNRYEN